MKILTNNISKLKEDKHDIQVISAFKTRSTFFFLPKLCPEWFKKFIIQCVHFEENQEIMSLNHKYKTTYIKSTMFVVRQFLDYKIVISQV